MIILESESYMDETMNECNRLCFTRQPLIYRIRMAFPFQGRKSRHLTQQAMPLITFAADILSSKEQKLPASGALLGARFVFDSGE